MVVVIPVATRLTSVSKHLMAHVFGILTNVVLIANGQYKLIAAFVSRAGMPLSHHIGYVKYGRVGRRPGAALALMN